MLSPLNAHFSITVGEITARETVLESLEYDLSCPRSIRHISTNPTNKIVTNIEDATLTETGSNTRAFWVFNYLLSGFIYQEQLAR